MARFRDLVADAGRDPGAVPISLLVFTRPTPARLEEYAALGLERIVLSAPSADLTPPDEQLRYLDTITPVVQEWAER